VVEDFELPEPKTREMVKVLKGLNLDGKVLLLTGGASESLKRASRNLPGLTVTTAQLVNTYEVVSHERIVLTESALKQLEARAI